MSEKEKEKKGNHMSTPEEATVEEEKELQAGEGEEASPPENDSPAGEESPREETLEEKLERLERENEELRNRILYLHAEMDNFRKRTAKEKEQLITYGNENLLRELLPVLDHLELAISHGEGDEKVRQFLSGVEMTYNEFLNVLKKFGVEQIDPGEGPFDPNLHEAVSSVEVEGREPGTIFQVVRKGYTLNGRLIRPVQVVVVKESEKGDGEEKEEEKAH
ncbi:MAG: nucleotide exchange factor GrpE [Deltaproteobacteria bacterium]|nr:MAG: nucleotide exchange factor GrpE [Deltaproteobacteria bacterium]